MDYKIKEVSPVERSITITVPVEEVNAAVGATVAMYRMRTEVKGFRRGKVPGNVVESKYRKQIYGEATTDLINVHINEIISKETLQPLSRVNVDAKELVRDEEFVYTISFEVAPKVDLPEYKGLKVTEVKAEVEDAELKEVEERILRNQATLKTLEEDRTPVDGDVATVSFGAYQNGEIVEGIKAENFDLEMGSQQALPEFEELIATLKPGETGEADVTFPADFINNNLAGQTVSFKAKLHTIKARVVPEMSEDVAKKAGFADVETLRKGIRESYISQRKQMNKADAQRNMLSDLLETVEFPLPPSLVEDRIDRLVADLESRLDRQGKGFSALGKTMEQIREEFRPEAEETAKSEIFLLSVASTEGLEVAREELDGFMSQLAMQTRQPLHELKKYYEDNNLIAPLKDRLLADKAMEFIYESAEVTEVEGEEDAKPAKKAPAKKAAPKKAAAKKEPAKKLTPKQTAVKFAVDEMGMTKSAAEKLTLAKLNEAIDEFKAGK